MKSRLERGQGVTEYALLIAFIAAVIVGGIFFTGQRMASYFDEGGAAVSAPMGSSGSPSGSHHSSYMSLGLDPTPTPTPSPGGDFWDTALTPTPTP